MPDSRYFVRTQINGDTVTMILDKTDKDNPVFTKEIAHNGQVVSVETIRPTDVVDKRERFRMARCCVLLSRNN